MSLKFHFSQGTQSKTPQAMFWKWGLFIGGISLEWGKRNVMKWDPSLMTYWCCSVCSFNQWVHKSLLGTMYCSRYWGYKDEEIGSLLSEESIQRQAQGNDAITGHCCKGAEWTPICLWCLKRLTKKAGNAEIGQRLQSDRCLSCLTYIACIKKLQGKPIHVMELTGALTYPNKARRNKM